MKEDGCNVAVLPHLELSSDLTQSLKPGKCRGEPSIPRLAGQVLRPTELCRQETRGGLCYRRCTRVSTSPAPTLGLHGSLGCRSSVAYRELFGNIPESTGKCLPCKNMPPRDNLNSLAKEQILPPYRNCSSQLDSSKLNGCGCKLDTSSLSFPLLLRLAHPARAAPTRTPHPPPPHLPGWSRGHSPARPGSPCWDAPASGRDFPGEPASSGARPTHLCLLHKERLRCDPAQAAV